MSEIRIPLTQGESALIDASDLAKVANHRWCVFRSRAITYAQANIKLGGKWTRVFMHRLIIGAGKGQVVDHRDGDGLNNTRQNIRLASRGQNQYNQGPRNGTSRFKGVSWSKVMRRWHAQIMKDRVYHNLGYYEREDDAARAYDAAALRLHGDFARINFPEAISG